MNLISSMRIRTKLLVTTIILSTLFCTAIGVYHFIVTKVNNNYLHLHSYDLQISGKAKAIQKHILLVRKAEMEFVHDLDEKHALVARNNILVIKDLAESIHNLATNDTQSGFITMVAQETELIQKRANEYNETFLAVVLAYKERGLHEDTGIYGRFRPIAHAIQVLCSANIASVPQEKHCSSKSESMKKTSCCGAGWNTRRKTMPQ